MPDAAGGVPNLDQRRVKRFDARCMMCSRVAGQLVDGAFVHHPDCARTPQLVGGRPRCCDCGGRLYLEATNSPLLSAADREAARQLRPSRW